VLESHVTQEPVRMPAEAGLESLVSFEKGAPRVMEAVPSFVVATHCGAGRGPGAPLKCCLGESPAERAVTFEGKDKNSKAKERREREGKTRIKRIETPI